MPLPAGVLTTTVEGGPYLDAGGNPAKGFVVFKPVPISAGEVVQVVSKARKTLDSNGEFTVAVPVSVDNDEIPDLTYEFSMYLDGGEYTRRTIQIPYSEEPINVSTLITAVPVDVTRFKFPSRAARPATPQPGEAYYNTVEGYAEYWDAIEEAWVLIGGGAGGGGAPSGPAGGSLAGTYPNPTLAANSVGTTQLTDLSVTAGKLSVVYVPQITYNNDLATTALALGDLEQQITELTKVLVLEAEDEVPPGTAAGTVIIRKSA